MSVDTIDIGITSFLELYAAEKKFKHVSLARSGATNFCIRLQIEEAIDRKADFVIVGATSSDRMEIPIPSVQHNITYPVTLKDIEYNGYRSVSYQNINTPDPKIISDSINNWTTDNYTWVPHDNFRRSIIKKDVIDAMKHYVTHLHNFQLEQMRDYFIIAEGLRKLESLNIPFVFLGGPMYYCDWSFVEQSKLWVAPQPWDMPYGIDTVAIHHNPQQAHNDFLQTILDMTINWNNA